MREAGARLVPVAMAGGIGGWDLPAWRQVLRDAAPRMAYVIADFHNPTGALASEEQRRELVEAARAAGTLLVADETMSELLLDPEVELPRPLCAFDPARQLHHHRRLGQQEHLGRAAHRLGARRPPTSSAAWSPPAPTPTSAPPSSNSWPSPG
ncbi:hypothetical protein GCM10020000_68350 [Streptomyces olivoverticillatus]